MNPRFSFLTTAYRTEHLIGATIESVQAQTRGDWEMIVVDNGNSDEMAAVVEAYAQTDPRIRLLRQENKGYRGGVMAAAAAAVGDYLCVLDSDDEVLPRYCERVSEVLAANPEIDAVGVDAYRFSEPQTDVDLPVAYMKSIGVSRLPSPQYPLKLADVLGGCVPYYTAAIRQQAWTTVGGYDPGIDGVDESVIIWCRLVRAFDVRLLPDILARYRLRADSLSRDPAGVEAFEAELIRSFVVGGGDDLSPADATALVTTVRRLGYQQEIRRARHALVARDTLGARTAARTAFGLRRTARAGAIYLGLRLAPQVLIRVHPAKQAITARTETAVGRLRAVLA